MGAPPNVWQRRSATCFFAPSAWALLHKKLLSALCVSVYPSSPHVNTDIYVRLLLGVNIFHMISYIEKNLYFLPRVAFDQILLDTFIV
jgi:hypothetical protein